MDIYNYDPITFELINTSKAEKDPLQKGNWLIPANSTTIAPCEIKKGFTNVFDESSQSWENKIDMRGVAYWLSDGQRHVISKLGEKKPIRALDHEPKIETQPEEIERLRALAYSNPVTGSDKYFLEASRKRATGDEDGAIEAELLGISRVKEIKEAIQ